MEADFFDFHILDKPRGTILNPNPLDLIEQNLIIAAVIVRLRFPMLSYVIVRFCPLANLRLTCQRIPEKLLM
jgi:hypothetical protein